MSYLVFPRVRVQAANMLSASFLMGGPPVFAAYGLGEALCFHLGGGAKVTGMALIHHNREALGQSFYGVFSPQQRRAAAFTFGKSANGSDYSSKNPHALSLQPVACAHLRVSIIWELEQVAGVKEAREFLHRARLSGGLVTGHGEIVLEDSLEAAFDRVGNGYVVTDRRDMLEDKGKNQAELLVEALGAQPSAGEDNTWLSATCLGYAAITSFEHRGGARCGYPHAFAEPLVGMVQYRSLRQWRKEADAEEALWRPVWLDDRRGAFVLRQEQTEPEDM
ncbi:type I-F CRISPR-associated protein Csy2 [Bilophila wadsworthia]|jgi:CRISPR-associated protein Csy2|uniref:type I-F CRISPR-associated protein Csy2 n=1 Tax=Bilophila wadsworthia TaxID=35833 RepID=UPI002432A605|nr:type I-F CRISPR-associated protein Csy2 [Bilophila wadsworthia]